MAGFYATYDTIEQFYEDILNYHVPYDGYKAELHKGERVLTASEAKAYVDNAMPSTLSEPTRQPEQTARSSSGEKTVINQTINNYSPDPLMPSQLAREARNAIRRL